MYHSENPTAFKNFKKNHLGVMWRSNHKTWVTRSLFSDWVTEVFGLTVRAYLQEKDLPLKVLLVMDSAPARPRNLMEELPDEFSSIKIHFLPPNTTDQQVIANLKNKNSTLKTLFRKCSEATSFSDVTPKDF